MNEKPTPEFKIRLDDGLVDTDDASRPSPKKPETAPKNNGQKTRQRSTRFYMVLMVVVIAALVAGYLDIRNRLLSVHSSGSQETRHLAEDLQSKFSSLSIKFSALEASTKGLIDTQAGLVASVSSLKEDLSKTNTSVSGLSSSKADKKSLQSGLADIEQELSPISETVKKVATDTAVMSAKLNVTTADLNAAAAKSLENLAAMKSVIEALQSEKASKKELLTEIDHIENILKSNQTQSNKQAITTSQSLQRLELKISALEARAGLAPPSGSQSSAPKQETTSGVKTPETPSPSFPEPGEFIERDITR